jgi:DNA invertase Pin-like site-specific DNA recombinase
MIRSRYDDGGYSGGSTDRPDLQRLLDDIRARKIDVIVVYKVDRLTRSLADFAKLVELFDAHGVSFVSVTQQFNTTTSMGRLTLNVLLSFAQFEREVTSERIRDKIAASKRKGLWVGGTLPLGYEMKDGKIAIVEEEAELVRSIFRRYLELVGATCCAATARHAQQGGTRLCARVRRRAASSKAGSFGITAEHVVDDVIALLVGSCWHHLLKNHTVAEEGSDPEGVHQTRLALRRLRTICALFRTAVFAASNISLTFVAI